MNRTYMVAISLLSMALGGCGTYQSASNTCDYKKIPYCCDRTAGTGTEILNCPSTTPASIEPAAGDELFRRSIRK